MYIYTHYIHMRHFWSQPIYNIEWYQYPPMYLLFFSAHLFLYPSLRLFLLLNLDMRIAARERLKVLPNGLDLLSYEGPRRTEVGEEPDWWAWAWAVSRVRDLEPWTWAWDMHKKGQTSTSNIFQCSVVRVQLSPTPISEKIMVWSFCFRVFEKDQFVEFSLIFHSEIVFCCAGRSFCFGRLLVFGQCFLSVWFVWYVW